jgi:nucleotide-binding universal stress UspA family protein
MGLKKIVVGVDGSDNSLAAVRWTADLVKDLGPGIETVAVHALGLLERIDRAKDPVPVEHHQAEIERLLNEEWCAPFSDAGVPYRTRLVYGPPVQVLLGTADREGADLVVMGSRGLGRFPERLLGSTSTQVANESHRPVVIVPPPDAEAGGH